MGNRIVATQPKRKFSPWQGRGIVNDGVNVVQGRRFPLEMRERRDDFPYITQPGDTIWKLAARYLGDPLNWWVIMDKNKIDYPLALEPGTKLTIPSMVSATIESRKRRA